MCIRDRFCVVDFRRYHQCLSIGLTSGAYLGKYSSLTDGLAITQSFTKLVLCHFALSRYKVINLFSSFASRISSNCFTKFSELPLGIVFTICLLYTSPSPRD